MIFDGDFDAGIQRSGAAGFAYFHCICHARFYASVALSIIAHAENAADYGRSQRSGDPDAEGQMFFSGTPLVFEELRSGANAPGASMDLNAQVLGFCFNRFQVWS